MAAKYSEWTRGRDEALLNKLGGMEVALKLLDCREVNVTFDAPNKRATIVAEEPVLKHIINLAVAPHIPKGWQLEEHKPGDAQFEWDPKKIRLYQSPRQRGKESIKGHELRKESQIQTGFNANLLDYLLANPHLIPEEWKEDEWGKPRYIYFWGTIYRSSDGYLDVRCLYWDGGAWGWSYHWLAYDWDEQCWAAVPVSELKAQALRTS